MRRLLGLCRYCRFATTLFPSDPRMPRPVVTLGVSHAPGEGASQRDFAVSLFGADAVARDWNRRSDALRSRVRRLVREARGWRRATIASFCGGAEWRHRAVIAFVRRVPRRRAKPPVGEGDLLWEENAFSA